jgi:hypothetical protein
LRVLVSCKRVGCISKHQGQQQYSPPPSRMKTMHGHHTYSETTSPTSPTVYIGYHWIIDRLKSSGSQFSNLEQCKYVNNNQFCGYHWLANKSR